MSSILWSYLPTFRPQPSKFFLKRISYIFKNETLCFSVQAQKIKQKFYPKKKSYSFSEKAFLIFQETETPKKKSLLFRKRKL